MPTVPDLTSAQLSLLDRYFDGHATGADHDAARALLRERPLLEPFVHRLRAEARIDALPSARETLPRMHVRLAHEGVERTSSRVARRSSPSGVRWMPIAGVVSAVCLLLLAVSLPSLRAVWRHAGTAHVQTAAREYSTRRAQRATITLPDGSQVVLAPDTRLRYRAESNGGRTVELTGQAYFTVTHDPAHPFTVRAGALSARVLGTAFVVRAYADDPNARVAVTDGKVAVGTENAPDAAATVLLPGDVARVVRGQTLTVARNVTLTDVFGWMRGQVTFENAPLRDVVRELERTYDLDITFADPALASRPVTTAIADVSARDMLELVTLAADVTYTWRGRTVVLSAAPHSATPRGGR